MSQLPVGQEAHAPILGLHVTVRHGPSAPLECRRAAAARHHVLVLFGILKKRGGDRRSTRIVPRITKLCENVVLIEKKRSYQAGECHTAANEQFRHIPAAETCATLVQKLERTSPSELAVVSAAWLERYSGGHVRREQIVSEMDGVEEGV